MSFKVNSLYVSEHASDPIQRFQYKQKLVKLSHFSSMCLYETPKLQTNYGGRKALSEETISNVFLLERKIWQ